MFGPTGGKRVTLLEPPPGRAGLPAFDDGWLVDGAAAPFLSYAEPGDVNWSDELESLHEEASRTHFMDVWTRQAILARVGDLACSAVIVDLGCSTGYLLEDLQAAQPQATLIGVDLVAAGLRKAHSLTPSARLLQVDVCDLPFADGSVDAIVSANLLEHVPRRPARAGGDASRAATRSASGDRRSGRTQHLRLLRSLPRTRAALCAPRTEPKGRLRPGSRSSRTCYIASLLYPPFWLVKQRNRLRYGRLEGDALSDASRAISPAPELAGRPTAASRSKKSIGAAAAVRDPEPRRRSQRHARERSRPQRRHSRVQRGGEHRPRLRAIARRPRRRWTCSGS